MKLFPTLSAALLGTALLSACTGTEETPPNLRLLVLTDGGKTLGYANSSETGQTGLQGLVALENGVDIEPLNSGRNFALVQRTGVQNRDVNLQVATSFAAPPFTPVCFTRAAMNALRDRLLALQECPNGPQQLALYRVDGTLVWTALLPTNLVTAPGPDTPPTRLAAGPGDTAVVARAALGGGSEVILVAPRTVGDTTQAVVGTPQPTDSIRDLAAYGSAIYAATDKGVRPLLPTGVPSSDATPVQTAFGTTRYDRLWAGSGSNANLLAAWRDYGQGSGDYLKLWDGRRSAAVNVSYLTELRDVSFALDGRMYALTRTTLGSYDVVLGLTNQASWSPQTHVSGLNDARAVTWVVPGSSD
ncbi:hypothetical protein D3875_08565 [Deinococcus cavernae]|uniref:Uncharacterized protein n=1 Tax=Deinococcus cavernae TaxID=2320857 RepID=A0A418V6A6_9DEIO|nr:hypothetical protein [Deinococcus cavernae]RJF71616.1 hypothetical protein D3875_08565 [Deinococcus cavernae]